MLRFGGPFTPEPPSRTLTVIFDTISAEKQSDNLAEDFVHREIHRSAFSRWFSIDEDTYEVGKIDANLSNGILSITIPKKEAVIRPLPRKIEVK